MQQSTFKITIRTTKKRKSKKKTKNTNEIKKILIRFCRNKLYLHSILNELSFAESLTPLKIGFDLTERK